MTLHDMTAVDLLVAYKNKKISPVEAVDAVIARIEAWEPKLKALYAPDFEGARRAAPEEVRNWEIIVVYIIPQVNVAQPPPLTPCLICIFRLQICI